MIVFKKWRGRARSHLESSVVLAALCWVGCTSAEAPGGLFAPGCDASAPVIELQTALGQTRRLGREQKESFSFRLKRGQRIRLEGWQQGLDLELRLCAPDLRRLATADTWIALTDPERIEWVAAESGQYRLEVSGIHDSPEGTYYLAWDSPRLATTSERAAHALRQRASQQLRQATRESPKVAEQSFAKALAALSSLGDLQAQAEAQRSLGVWWSTQPNAYEPTRKALETARDLWRQASSPAGELEATTQLCTLAHETGRLEEADVHCAAALRLAERVGDPRWLSNALLNEAVVRRRRGDSATAETMLRRALELIRQERSADAECKALHRLATLLGSTGRRREAVRLGQQTVEACDKLGGAHERVWARTNLALDANSTGDNRQARRALREAAELAAELSSHGLSAVVALAQGDLAASMGLIEEAKGRYEEALDFAKAAGKRDLEARALLNLGWLARLAQGSAIAADDPTTYFDRAQELATVGLDIPLRAAVERAQGIQCLDRGDSRGAEVHVREAAALYRGVGDRWGEAVTLRDWSLLDRRAGRPEEAARKLREARIAANTLESPALEASIFAAQASLESETGRKTLALELIRDALGLFEMVNQTAGEPQVRAAELALRRTFYNQAIDLELEVGCTVSRSGCAERAFAWSERSRARGLLDLLAQRDINLRAGIEAELLEHEEQVWRRHSRAQRDLLDMKRRPRVDMAELTRKQEALRLASRDLEDIRRRIHDESPWHAAPVHAEAMSFPELRRRLLGAPNIALLELAVGEDQAVLFVAQTTGVEAFRLGSTAALRQKVEPVLLTLRAGPRSKFDPEAALALYRFLLGPAEPLLRNVRELIIVSDDILLGFPFEALVTSLDDSGKPRFLVQRWSVRYAPSATVLAAVRSDSSSSASGYTAFADPFYPEVSGPAATPGAAKPAAGTLGSRLSLTRLPASQLEVEKVAGLFRSRGQAAHVFVRAEAAEENLRRAEVAQAAFLHFAAHASADERDPGAAGLYLSQRESTEEANGIINLHEIAALKLNASLVVLSACRSGLGARLSGEGFVGLSWAFLQAGARGLLVSLWDVEDRATADLIYDFYFELLADPRNDRAQALRRAQLVRIARDVPPAEWASFILIGNAL